MTIPKCEEGQRSTLFGNFPSDVAALQRLRSVDPDATEEALCKSDGDVYRALTKRIDVTKPSGTADPRAELVFQILDKQNSILAARIGLEKNRVELAEALKTRNHLKDPNALKDTPAEKLLKSIAYSAFSFGVVTELFKDGAIAAYLGSLLLSGSEATNLLYTFEKIFEMKKLQVQGNLCGPLSMPGQASAQAELWKGLAGPILAGAAAIFGMMALSHSTSGNTSQVTLSASASHNEISKTYAQEELKDLSLTQLREIDSELTSQLSLVSGQTQNVYAEARSAYRDIYTAYLGELRTRNLGEIKDDQLRAIAQTIIAKGGGEPDASFIEKLGITELVGIGVGFGVGTGALHRVYQNVAPWRDFLDRRMHRIKESAHNDAAKQVEQLRERGVLKSCDPEPKPLVENNSHAETLKLGLTALGLGLATLALAACPFDGPFGEAAMGAAALTAGSAFFSTQPRKQ